MIQICLAFMIVGLFLVAIGAGGSVRLKIAGLIIPAGIGAFLFGLGFLLFVTGTC